jgi:NAD(P)-dependent dehydrogenase (short-subunit alcohol dehydrogenase family)
MGDEVTFLEEMFGLAGATVALTGGGGVLGRAMAEGFLRAGANVALWDHGQETHDEAVEHLSAASGAPERIGGTLVEASDEGSVGAAIRSTLERFGTLDILVNAAGGNRGRSAFVDTEVSQFETVLKLNLVAGLLVPTKTVCRHWIGAGVKGSVINVASMGSYVPLSGVWAYDAAKAGVLNLTMAAAREFAPHGIRVNAVAPGFFLGKQNRALLVDQETGDLTPRGRSVISRTPLGRFGDARELMGAVLFLASSRAAGFVTGTCIPVDGGFLVDCI